MKKDYEIEKINEKILELSNLEKIEEEDLIFNGESIFKTIFKMENNEDKLNLLTDLIIINADINRNEINFITEILKIGDNNIIENIVFNNKNELDFNKNILRSALNEEVKKETFISICKLIMPTVMKKGIETLLDYIDDVEYISDYNNDKILLLLLAHDKNNKEELPNSFPILMSEKSNVKLFKVLLSSKINMHTETELNENALFYINGKNEKEIKEKHKLLLNSGINSNLINIYGESYLDKNKNLNQEDLNIINDKKNKISLSV